MNTFFQHKDCHKYTRVLKNRNEKSIIVFRLIWRKDQKLIQDVRARRGQGIANDHYLVATKTKISQEDGKINATSEIAHLKLSNEKIRSYQLNDKEIALKFMNKLDKV